MLVKNIVYSYDKKEWSESFPKWDSEQTLIFIFAAPLYYKNPQPIKEVAEHYPNSKIIGCSGSGEISGPYILEKSLSLAIIKFESTTINILKKEITDPSHSYQVGREITQELSIKNNLCGIFVLSEGFGVDGAKFAEGLEVINNNSIIIAGGLASDGEQSKKSWVIYNGEILSKHIIAVGFYGDDIELSYGSKSGWDIFGPERLVTRSKENIIYELDGKPALSLYKDYLGEKAKKLPTAALLYPLSIRQDLSQQEQLIRCVVDISEKEQALMMSSHIKQGSIVHLMRSNLNKIIDSASDSIIMAQNKKTINNTESPMLSIVVSCFGRRLLLGNRTEEEISTLLEKTPKNATQVGFYSHGEISPLINGRCEFHNHTVTVFTIQERKK